MIEIPNDVLVGELSQEIDFPLNLIDGLRRELVLVFVLFPRLLASSSSSAARSAHGDFLACDELVRACIKSLINDSKSSFSQQSFRNLLNEEEDVGKAKTKEKLQKSKKNLVFFIIIIIIIIGYYLYFDQHIRIFLL